METSVFLFEWGNSYDFTTQEKKEKDPGLEKTSPENRALETSGDGVTPSGIGRKRACSPVACFKKKKAPFVVSTIIFGSIAGRQ
jgi:hypothetical protein